ncbi:sulfatase-like hydrolase/transferase [Paenibacillus sp. strain BS8-2]
MSSIRNVLWIMADQFRADCLSSAGHPVVSTPNLDALAEQGVRFDQAYVQSAVCGPSRACAYTGRYMHTHGSLWNGVPLPADELTIGNLLRPHGIRAALCGKTHHIPDHPFHQRLESIGANPALLDGIHAGLEPWEVLEMSGEGWVQHLKDKGYTLPFDEYPAHAPFIVTGPDGEWLNGWRFDNCRYPTVIEDQDGDTAFLTNRAISFMEETEEPWFLHLSYFKPHWPNVAADPYHSMFDPERMDKPIRSDAELTEGHPMLDLFRQERRGTQLDHEDGWRTMRATYYGLIKQLDDYLGKLFQYMDQSGRMKDTLIVFTSDHGEYMGDHWMFEKELFYDQAIRVPLIIRDPSPAADATRGKVEQRFVELIDVLPTVLDAFKLPTPGGVQGRSLLPCVRDEGESVEWRTEVYCDWDFRFHTCGDTLGLKRNKRRAWMIRDNQYKYVHFNGLPAMLFDLIADKDELHNIAQEEWAQPIVHVYMRKLLEWRQSTEDNSRASWAEKHMDRPNDFIPERIHSFHQGSELL